MYAELREADWATKLLSFVHLGCNLLYNSYKVSENI